MKKKNCKRGSWVCAKIILSGLTSKSVPVWFINRHNSVAVHFPKALMFSRRTSTIKTTNYREVSHSTCNSVLWEESLKLLRPSSYRVKLYWYAQASIKITKVGSCNIDITDCLTINLMSPFFAFKLSKLCAWKWLRNLAKVIVVRFCWLF